MYKNGVGPPPPPNIMMGNSGGDWWWRKVYRVSNAGVVVYCAPGLMNSAQLKLNNLYIVFI